MTDFVIDEIEDKKKERQKREDRRRNREVDDLKKVLSVPEGRRFVWRLLCESGIYRATWDTNALSMAFKEGKRDLALFLIGDINQHCALQYAQMQREAKSDAATEEKTQV